MAFLVTVLVLVFLYVWIIRPWVNTYGATPDEVSMSLPGDDLLPDAQGQSTRGTTIHAPAEKIWPWLVQLGQGRGGFYSYDRLENLFGLDIHSADHIMPEHQDLVVGDHVLFGKNGPAYLVAVLEPQRAMILRMLDQKTMAVADPAADNYYEATWGFILEPVDEQTTRLLIRGRGATNNFTGRLMNWMIDPVSFIMEERMMRGIKARAERPGDTVPATG